MSKKIVPIILFLLLSPGCIAKRTTQINAAMDSWMGAHYSKMIALWGPPSQILEDGYGGQIFVYNYDRTVTYPGRSTTTSTGRAIVLLGTINSSETSRTVYNPPKTFRYTSWRMFYADEDGIIYHWSWKGL